MTAESLSGPAAGGTASEASPWIEFDRTAGPVLRCGGAWTLRQLATAERAIASVTARPASEPLTLDLRGLAAIDTVGAVLLLDLAERIGGAPDRVAVRGTPARLAPFFDAVAHQRGFANEPDPSEHDPLMPLVRLGRTTLGILDEARELTGFFGLLIVSLGRIIVRPRRLRLTSTIHHMETTGIDALPIVGLLALLIGIVISYQAADQLRLYGAEVFVVNLVGISILRELGVLICSIIVAGRSGSAFTAQIGTMKVNQEVDAMETMGLDPIETLVLPRVIALVLVLPLLTFYTNMLALAGAALMVDQVLDIPFNQFREQLNFAIVPSTFYAGMIKAPVFAFVIAMVGCYQGLKVTGSAESVGRLTTLSVVQSIFLVIVIDAIFSIFYSAIGF